MTQTSAAEPEAFSGRFAWADHLPAGDRWLGGVRGLAQGILVEQQARQQHAVVVVVVPSPPAMDEMLAELEFLGAADPDELWEKIQHGKLPADSDFPAVFPFPSLETLPYEDEEGDPHLRRQRLRVYELLDLIQKGSFSSLPLVLVTPIAALQPRLPNIFHLHSHARVLRPGMVLEREDLVPFLVEEGYENVEFVYDCGQFSIRGGILDIYPVTLNEPVRIEFFDNEIESMRVFDIMSQRSVRTLDRLVLSNADEQRLLISNWRNQRELHHLADFLPERTHLVWCEPAEVKENAQRTQSLAEKMFYQFQNDQDSQENASQLIEIPPEHLYMDLPTLQDSLVQYEWSVFNSEKLVAEVDQAPFAAKSKLAQHNLPITGSKLVGLEFKMRVQNIVDRINAGETFLIACDNQGMRQRITDLLIDALEQGGTIFDESLMRRAGSRRSRAKDYTLEAARGSKHPKEKQAQLPGVQVTLGQFRHGFHDPALNFTVTTDQEIFDHFHKVRIQHKKAPIGAPIINLVDLRPNQYVVHVDHGIGQFVGLKRLKISGREGEYLELKYADNDTLYVPIDQIDRVNKYLGNENSTPRLHSLGSKAWQKTKARVQKALEDMTEELLALYASREVKDGHSFAPDTSWQREFEASFPFNETPDQWQAIQEVKQDMESPRCMDRLICGDVGFGKTEVAMRAAFKSVCEGKQVAILAPTTVLVQQHFETFLNRMEDYPVEIDFLNRFRTPGEAKKILAKTAQGEIDILLGTHRLLQKDVRFKDLGLVIIDEEHRFGVRHKETLKKLRTEVDVLSLSATPIPRTLYMSMSGVRDISTISTPPSNRLPVETFISAYRPEVVESAVLRELARGGQVFLLHNRVESIYGMAEMIQELVPEARVSVGHGQMEGHQLEKVMQRFVAGDVDVLVCTTIIESGLDISNANTIIINRADTFGLAALYQLRGRVGRSDHQAYCYLLVPSEKGLSSEARQRLMTLQEFTELGSGFQIAMRDLEMRGMGNLLGREQHGYIADLGFDLYSELLTKAVQKIKTGQVAEPAKVSLDTVFAGEFPAHYIPSPAQRMAIHKRLARITTPDELARLKAEIEDLYGKLPPLAKLVFTQNELREQAKLAMVDQVRIRSDQAQLRFSETGTKRFNPTVLAYLEAAWPGRIRLSVNERIYLEMSAPEKEDLWDTQLQSVLAMLAENN